jgi:hypothetical protein
MSRLFFCGRLIAPWICTLAIVLCSANIAAAQVSSVLPLPKYDLSSSWFGKGPVDFRNPPLFRSPYSFALGGGPSSTRFSGTYTNSQNQYPYSATSHANGGELCGTLSGYWPIGGSGFEYGGGINFCQDFTGTTTLFDIYRPGPDRRLTATVKPGSRFEPYIGFHVAGPGQTHFYFRGGANFAYEKLTLSREFSFANNEPPSASTNFWNVGVGLQAGIAGPLCSDCAWGSPVNFSLGGKFALYNTSHSVYLPSENLNITETATLRRTTQYSAIGTLSIPLNLSGRPYYNTSDRRLKRDIVLLSHLDNGLGIYAYRYLWSDQRFVGVMAQEVALVEPDAVLHGADGYLRVNYARLGLRLQTWEQWAAAR